MIEKFLRFVPGQRPVAPSLAAMAAILFAISCCSTAQAASPAEMISSYRLAHGEGRVTIDPALNRIAREQAEAMAARDVMDHNVLKPLSDRAANLNAERAAENLAQGDHSFGEALAQWIGSYGHRQNLLMHEGTRVGVASARNPKSGEIYWAMEIAGPEPERVKHGKSGAKDGSCRLMLNDMCL